MLDQNSQESQNTSSHSDSGADQDTGGDQGNTLDNASEGGDLDFKSLFETQKQEFAQELGKRDQKLGETQRTIDKLRSALTGEDDQPTSDPIEDQIQQASAEMDEVIAAAMAAEKAGRPIPLTANTAIKSLQFKIQALQDKRETQKEMAALKARVERLSNPQTQIDQQAFSNMDSHLMSSLNTIYGPNEDTSHVFEAVSKTIVAEIKDLKKNDPKMWDRVSRDRQAQVKLVNHFVKKAIPPRAREIMEEDHIRRTPLSLGELQAAFTEARELSRTEKNPQRREEAARHMSKIRQDILSRLMEKNMGGGSKTRMSELF